jgi:hypothetical protein
MIRHLILILIVLTATRFLKAESKEKNRLIPEPVICYASKNVERIYIPPPSDVEFRLKSGQAPKSDIKVNYSLFPVDAKAAFEYATTIWENIIESPIPIYIQANWRSKNDNVLGSCNANHFNQNFKYAPHENRLYPGSLAEKITGKEITGQSEPDMTAEFNRNIKWYFGTDGKTPDSLYDFVTVVLHEIGHGLGITGFFNVSGDVGFYARSKQGEASAFDLLVVKPGEGLLVDSTRFKNSSSALKGALTSNDLYAQSPVAMTQNNGTKPRLFAPLTWDSGSSIYHLNDANYTAGSINALMTHAIAKGEAVHDPGPLTRGMLEDIGWKSTYIDFEPVKDIETIKPVTFKCNIRSDYPIKENGTWVYISSNGFKTKPDSVKLVKNNQSNEYSTIFTPKSTGIFQYYLKITDENDRDFHIPTEAPSITHKVTVGPDLTLPVIAHSAIPYYLNNGKNLEVNAEVTDNTQIDSVFVEYTLNGTKQNTFVLKPDTGKNFKGNFNFNPSTLKDADVVEYRIIATDKSLMKNTARFPAGSPFSFKIEQIFAPVGGYINDFNSTTSDFITTDFKIKTEPGFADGALHSAHPYISPNKDDTYFEFYTILKRPVILTPGATMSFDEVVLVEPGENGAVYGDDNFWDYVIIEGSKDKGVTWKPIAPGYDSGFNSTWLSNYNSKILNQSSQAMGKKEWFVTHHFQPLQNRNYSAGDTVLFRFRLHSDPYANGWGWVIDNLRIQFPVSADNNQMTQFIVKAYPNPAGDILHLSIQANGFENQFSVEIFNIYGNRIYSSEKENVIPNSVKQINLNGINQGLYFLIVKNKGKVVFSEKIVIKK